MAIALLLVKESLRFLAGWPPLHLERHLGNFSNTKSEGLVYLCKLHMVLKLRDYMKEKEQCLDKEYPTFLYVMPMSPTRVFFEETCLASKEAMPFDLLKKRLMSRLEAMGVQILKIYEESYHPTRVISIVFQVVNCATSAVLTYYEARLNTRRRNLLGFSLFLICSASLVVDSGKLHTQDILLKRLRAENHRVLLFAQMTKMLNILEEYMNYRKYKYFRLDGSSSILDRRDMVRDFQQRNDIFVFLLSTRAGGIGINLTAADTVIFYESDWNPTLDLQAMDRAHRLGQTKEVTVYRLICKETIEEKILQRASQKNTVQQLVMTGGHVQGDLLKPEDVVSLLIDDAQLEQKLREIPLQTVVCFPFMDGVLELGTTELVLEDGGLIQRATTAFWDLTVPVCSEQSVLKAYGGHYFYRPIFRSCTFST